MRPTVAQVLREAGRRLAASGAESSGLDAELLLAHVLDCDRLALYTNHDREVSQAEAEAFETLLNHRGEGFPLQWLTGRQEFMSLEIGLEPGVFIPRPETEVLVEEAVPLAAAMAAGRGLARLLEVGTGSGAIAVALAARVPDVRLRAYDLSSKAVRTARGNVARHGLAERVEVIEGDPLVEGCGDEHWREADMVVSNPPYIPSADIAGLQREVAEHEPKAALDGGADGLDCYRRIAGRARLLRPGAFLLLECGLGQSRRIAALLEGAGFEMQRVVADYAGIERVLVASRPAA